MKFKIDFLVEYDILFSKEIDSKIFWEEVYIAIKEFEELELISKETEYKIAILIDVGEIKERRDYKI